MKSLSLTNLPDERCPEDDILKVCIRQSKQKRMLATITFQNLFRMYGKLAGMTGTAETEKEELYKIYGIDVLVIPTNRADNRTDHSDRIYKNTRGKHAAILQKIKECRAKKQPKIGRASCRE